MDWKKRYAQIIVGDKVKIIKANNLCDHASSCGCKKYVGNIGIVKKIDPIHSISKGTIVVELPKNNIFCTFPEDCLQKVIK